MQPIYLYYYRNMINPPVDDKGFVSKIIEESIMGEEALLKSYEDLSKKEGNDDNAKLISNMINDSKVHIRLLQNIYGNLNGKLYSYDSNGIKPISNIKEIIIRNVSLSKDLRKIMYASTNNTHKSMLFDIIVDNLNTNTLLEMIYK